MKKFFPVLLGSSLLLPGLAYAVGLGAIKINSTLNQPLDAKIRLLSLRSVRLADIKAVIATPEQFKRVNLESGNMLALLSFQISKDAHGRPIVRIFSKEPITDPYIQLLLDVKWPRGQLLRSYNILLDPPSYDVDSLKSSQRPKLVASKAEHQVKPEKVELVSKGVTTLQDAKKLAALKPAKTATVSTKTQPQPHHFFGPVREADNLWDIARHLNRPKHISLNQIMLAILQKNPQAFVHGDMNRLKFGVKIALPTQHELKSVSRTMANKEIARHDAHWRRREAVPAVTTRPAPKIIPQLAHKQTINNQVVAPKQEQHSALPTPRVQVKKVVAPRQQQHSALPIPRVQETASLPKPVASLRYAELSQKRMQSDAQVEQPQKHKVTIKNLTPITSMNPAELENKVASLEKLLQQQIDEDRAIEVKSNPTMKKRHHASSSIASKPLLQYAKVRVENNQAASLDEESKDIEQEITELENLLSTKEAPTQVQEHQAQVSDIEKSTLLNTGTNASKLEKTLSAELALSVNTTTVAREKNSILKKQLLEMQNKNKRLMANISDRDKQMQEMRLEMTNLASVVSQLNHQSSAQAYKKPEDKGSGFSVKLFVATVIMLVGSSSYALYRRMFHGTAVGTNHKSPQPPRDLENSPIQTVTNAEPNARVIIPTKLKKKDTANKNPEVNFSTFKPKTVAMKKPHINFADDLVKNKGKNKITLGSATAKTTKKVVIPQLTAAVPSAYERKLTLAKQHIRLHDFHQAYLLLTEIIDDGDELVSKEAQEIFDQMQG